MDNTNLNSGSPCGWKRYILHEILMALWVGCGSHKLALWLKHLLEELPCAAEFDIVLLSLWKYFQYRPLAINFLQELLRPTMKIKHLVCPNTTRWTSHGRACKALYEGYQAEIGALTVCYNKRNEPKALGIFMAITSEIFIASYHNLCHVMHLKT